MAGKAVEKSASKYKLVIVESPNKVRHVQRFLGDGYKVVASVGHVRDLPTSAADIPAAYKGQKWARLGVDVEHDFAPLYVVKARGETVANLKAALKNASEVLLATDEDREGESISWHLIQLLNIKVPIRRMRFNEITLKAVQESLHHLSDIDMDLVRAQEARRIVDRLFGYMVSPVLWQKMVPNLSAGRVQSVVVRMLVDRERERLSFVSGNYADISAKYITKDGSPFEADLVAVAGQTVAGSDDLSPKTGKLKEGSKALLLDKTSCQKLLDEIASEAAKVAKVDKKPKNNSPYPPFTTSTMQQEASRKLHFSPSQTMRVAQSLFENGFITYMRTDSTNLSPDGIGAARRLIVNDFGSEFLPEKARYYVNKAKNSQEAHEAIRPAIDPTTNLFFTTQAVRSLGPDAQKLYELIYKRTIACQMADARVELTTVVVNQGRAAFKASGKTIIFPGYMRAYVEGSDDPSAKLASQEKLLPKLSAGDVVKTGELKLLEHTTKPPARYTHAEMLKTLELAGIGRPSTWSSILELVVNRTYAFMKGQILVPTFLAMAITNLLEQYFTNLVDYKFTAKLEEDLDQISNGKVSELDYLKKFYYGAGYPGLLELVESSGEKIDPRVVCGVSLGQDGAGRAVEVRVGRFGLFLTNGEARCSIPDDTVPDELTIDKASELLAKAGSADSPIGIHPETKQPIYLKNGRFGPYVQMGDKSDKADKPEKAKKGKAAKEAEAPVIKTAPLLKGMKPEDIDLETAIKLLSLPRTLGKNEAGEDVVAASGRFGPFVKAGTETRSIPTNLSPLTITLAEALDLISKPKVRGKATRALAEPKAEASGRLLGVHPESGVELRVKDGRFGPYITDGKINATVPKARQEEAFSDSFTFEEALAVYDAKVAKIAADGGVVKRRFTRRAVAAKKGPSSKTAKTSKATKAAGTKKANN